MQKYLPPSGKRLTHPTNYVKTSPPLLVCEHVLPPCVSEMFENCSPPRKQQFVCPWKTNQLFVPGKHKTLFMDGSQSSLYLDEPAMWAKMDRV